MLKKLTYSLLFSSLLFSCAVQMAPSGGPIDEIPPSLIYESPSKAEVSVPTDKKVELIFSEWIDPKSAAKSITIFPILKDGFDVRISGKKISIKPNTKFSDSTTYHIGLSNDLEDVHGVNIPKPLDIIFSTGPIIDTLTIKGCIPDPERGTEQPKVALFRYNSDNIDDTLLLSDPDYLTQTDTLGKFQFTHIKADKYFILAFIDSDKNNRLTSGSEKVFTCSDKIIEAGIEQSIHLFYTLSDTSVNSIENITPLSPKLLSGNLKRAYQSSDYYSKISNIKLMESDSITKEATIEKLTLKNNSNKVLIKLKDTLTLNQYLLSYQIKRPLAYYTLDTTSKDSSYIQDTVFYDTLRFNGTNKTDSLNVKFESCTPLDTISINQSLTLSWSNLVKPLFDSIVAFDTSGDTTKFYHNGEYSSKTELIPSEDLVAGTEYTLQIYDSMFIDLNGHIVTINEAIDSTDTTALDSIVDKGEIIFTTIEPGKICYSLSAIPQCEDEITEKSVLQFNYVNSTKEILSTPKGQLFTFVNLPSGNGTFKWFKDYNNNLERDPGHLFPWRKPEFLYSYPDTVEARARWDVENYPLENCFTCEAQDTATIDTSNQK